MLMTEWLSADGACRSADFTGLANRAIKTGGETTGGANCNRVTASSIDMIQAYGDGGSLADRDNITVTVHGDLA